GDVRSLGELPQQVDQPPHRPHEVALVTAEGLRNDPRPVVVTGGPAEHRGHEARMHADGHAEMPRALRLPDRVGGGDQPVHLMLELRALLEEGARDRRLARGRFLEWRRAERGGLGERELVEQPARDRLGQQQLVVVAQAGDEPALRLQPTVADRAELLEDLDHTQELLPVGAAKRIEGGATLPQPLVEPLEVARGVIAPRRGAPRAAMALDGRQRRLRPLLALAPNEVRHGQARELLGQMAEPARLAAADVARHVQRRRGPEDALDEAALEADDRAVRQQRVEQRAVTTDRVHAEDHREARRALAADEREPPGLGLGPPALTAASPPAQRLPPRLHLLARAAVAADA